jgi:SM-20-related protein
MREIEVVDNFFSKELYDEFIKIYDNVPMRYGWLANPKSDKHGHWNYSLIHSQAANLADFSSKLPDETSKKMWNYVQEYLKEECVLLRCYINSHTYGVEGYFHKDTWQENETTAVLYMNSEWHPNWAGETVFMDNLESSKITQSVLPKSNRMVLFPSEMQHCARGVSRKCIVLRKTFMFKFRKKRSENFEKLSKFLFDSKAVDFNHSYGSLHDHLVRVFQLLETNKFPEHVCYGGGLHSVFGTNVFTKNICSDNDNLTIIENFGEKAFELAKLFSAINRPKSLETPVSINFDSVIVELNNEAHVNLPIETYNDLCAIECANLLDQKSLNTDKYPNLQKIWNQNVEKNK